MVELLICLGHSVLFLYSAVYALLFKKSVFDYFYLFYLYIVLLHWTFFNGECVITYMYKKYKNKDYVAGENIEHNEFTHLLGNPQNQSTLPGLIYSAIVFYNVVLVSKRNRISISYLVTFAALLIMNTMGSNLIRTYTSEKTNTLYLETMKYILLVFGVFSFWLLKKRLKF